MSREQKNDDKARKISEDIRRQQMEAGYDSDDERVQIA